MTIFNTQISISADWCGQFDVSLRVHYLGSADNISIVGIETLDGGELPTIIEKPLMLSDDLRNAIADQEREDIDGQQYARADFQNKMAAE